LFLTVAVFSKTNASSLILLTTKSKSPSLSRSTVTAPLLKEELLLDHEVVVLLNVWSLLFLKK
jgi:hypothetical protein